MILIYMSWCPPISYPLYMYVPLTEIRHPEELSLAKPVESEHLKFNYGDFKRQEEKRRRVTLGAMPQQHNGHHRSNGHHSASMLDVTVNDRPDTNT